MNSQSTDLLVWGIVVHLIADWILQNDWQANNKADPNHPAGIVHAAIHAVGLMFVFPAKIAALIGVVHYIIDLRFGLKWWRETFRQTTEGPAALHVAIWGDQVLHIAIIALFGWLKGRGK
jgi:hypothetical protein